MSDLTNKFYGSLIGAIVADAFSSPMEFKVRDTYEVSRDMVRNENFNLEPGSFTDDSSMLLCLAESVTIKKGFDWEDQMKRYVKWRTEGYLSTNGKVFDVGRTVSMAISDYLYEQRCPGFLQLDDNGVMIGKTGDGFCGNGSLMRLCPVPLFFHYDIALAKHYARLSSQITHAHPECLESADMMAEIIVKMLTATSKDFHIDPMQYTQEKVRSIARGDYKTLSRDQIFTTGYVIHTLEAALWVFHKFDTFEEGVLQISTMGSDTDTVACVFAQIAGAYYGFHAIPTRWINQLQQSEMIMSVVKPFVDLVLK